MDLQGKLVIFSAPSGSGKTTLVHRILERGLNLEFSISATTRSKRPHEVDGKDYYFLSVEDFKKKIQEDAFLEWEEVYENQFYGTLRSEIQRIWNQGRHVIFDIDVAGGVNLKRQFGDRAMALFIKAPSMDVLAQRLSSRGTENEESLKKRLAKAALEMESAQHFDQIIVNDDLETAVNQTYDLLNVFLES